MLVLLLLLLLLLLLEEEEEGSVTGLETDVKVGGSLDESLLLEGVMEDEVRFCSACSSLLPRLHLFIQIQNPRFHPLRKHQHALPPSLSRHLDAQSFLCESRETPKSLL